MLQRLGVVNEPLSRELLARGYALMRRVLPGDLRALASSLGEVVHRSDIVLDPRKRTHLASPDAVPLHTDHPDVSFIAWRCEVQDEEDGASLLVDGHSLLARLSVEELDVLAAHELPCPSLEGRSPVTTCPIVDCEGDLFFAPWLMGPAVPAISRFCALLAETRPVEVRLGPGDVLIVANRRMLHGRRALPPDSRRRLERIWIR